MMGVHERPDDQRRRRRWCRPSNHGVKLMSMGFLLDGDQPVIWRGPMIMKTIQQFFSAVEWGELDYPARGSAARARATRSFRSARPCRWTAA